MDPRPPISVLILGYGSQTTTVVHKLVAEGCLVVVGNGTPDYESAISHGYQAVPVNLGNSATIKGELENARFHNLGPDKYFNVIIYHAFHLGACTQEVEGECLSLDVTMMRLAAETDIHCVYAVAKFAIQGFEQLSQTVEDGVPRVFITTGNSMPFMPALPMWLSLGFGRVTQAYLMDYLASHHSPKFNMRQQFYFAYQVSLNDNLIPGEDETPSDAQAHAYWELINSPSQQDWHVRFDAGGNILQRT